MKKQHLLTFLLASFFIVMSLHVVHAQNSISGDDICGSSVSTKCTADNAKAIASRAVSLAIEIGVVLLGVLIPIRILFAYKENIQGNAGAYKAAKTDILNGLVGLVVVTAVVGGLYLVLLQFLGVDSGFLKLISDSFIPHTYAANGYLENPLGVDSLYDFILVVVKLVMSFFIYPALIAMWVWSGFAYVSAQGNPEAIKKAHQWLMWAVISTIAILMTQGLLLALKGTVNNILPASSSNPAPITQPLPPPNPINTRPCDGKAQGDACRIEGGSGGSGTCTSSGFCDVSAGTVLPSSCSGLPIGTRCRLGSRLGSCDSSHVCFLDINQTVR